MPRLRSVVLSALLVFGIAAAKRADAQPIDRWHYIDGESVLHSDRVDGLQGAGVIQDDATFAMLYLGLPEENGVVTVALPVDLDGHTLLSTLISSRGQRFARELSAEQLDIAQISDTTFAYSFPITAKDVDLFKSAQTWVLSVGEQRWPVTLTGSRAAIVQAEREREAKYQALSTPQPASDTQTSD